MGQTFGRDPAKVKPVIMKPTASETKINEAIGALDENRARKAQSNGSLAWKRAQMIQHQGRTNK